MNHLGCKRTIFFGVVQMEKQCGCSYEPPHLPQLYLYKIINNRRVYEGLRSLWDIVYRSVREWVVRTGEVVQNQYYKGFWTNHLNTYQKGSSGLHLLARKHDPQSLHRSTCVRERAWHSSMGYCLSYEPIKSKNRNFETKGCKAGCNYEFKSHSIKAKSPILRLNSFITALSHGGCIDRCLGFLSNFKVKTIQLEVLHV